MEIHGHICSPPLYVYKGWTFEFGMARGPFAKTASCSNGQATNSTICLTSGFTRPTASSTESAVGAKDFEGEQVDGQ